MRRTKIICTIGPASESVERLRELMLAGMNVARFNFSHGTHEEQREKFRRVVQAREELGLPVATMLDTKGPEIRLRDFEGGRAELVSGQQFVLTTEEILGTAQKAAISYKNLKNDIEKGTTILIDDGLIEMTVEEIRGEEIVCRVVNGGFVSNHKGLNVPGAVLSMPYISEVDRADILFGIEMGHDILAASFVRCKEDILEVRKILEEHNCNMKIIAKIENMQGIQNLEEILSVSDGIMVARGDMGVEIPFEEVPILQKKMIKLANDQGKHVITATQMLESMIKNPRPTRAETTDIANAIYDGTTAIMLSGESAAGKYPVEAVMTMAKIAECAEKDIDYGKRMRRHEHGQGADITTALAYATCTAAMDLEAAAIITVTMSGFTAAAISRFKPQSPIIGCGVQEKVCRQLNLLWGVTPLKIQEEENAETLFANAVEEAKRAGYVKKGDVVVITAGVPLGVAGTTNMIHVVEVG
ncbi:pyruvate kinase [Acetatifactor aquisgranensis]|uniref:pyruvate kinase n=1 Tax=Acetatifactor aquisgranensis TaxID=2941233 RepID=UPI00203C76E5|nr:pyruvate kinase [Acetatifactor aquisgranensis]